MIRFFDGFDTIEAVKAEYKRLAKKFHPDVGGDTATMQEINNQYSEAVRLLQSGRAGRGQSAKHVEVPEEFIAVISKIIGLNGLEIDLVGSWIWVTGSTYPNREALKAAGFHFSRQKTAWYWHPVTEYCGKSSRKSLDEIKDKYGAQRIFGAAPRKLAAN